MGLWLEFESEMWWSCTKFSVQCRVKNQTLCWSASLQVTCTAFQEKLPSGNTPPEHGSSCQLVRGCVASQLKEVTITSDRTRGGSDFLADRKGLGTISEGSLQGSAPSAQAAPLKEQCCQLGTTHSPHKPCVATLYSDCLAPVTSVEMLPGSRSSL